MTVEIRFVDEAVTELEEAIRWYEDRRNGLGLVFLVAFDRTVKSIDRSPRAARLVDGVSSGIDVRRVTVARFPYYVAFLVSNDATVVLAVAHERRRPRYWTDRIGS